MRIVKLYWRSIIMDKRFNHLAILKYCADELIEIDLEDIMA